MTTPSTMYTPDPMDIDESEDSVSSTSSSDPMDVALPTNTTQSRSASEIGLQPSLRPSGPDSDLNSHLRAQRYNELYPEGTPRWTKKAIQEAQARVERCKPGDIVYIPALDGADVGFEVMTERIERNKQGVAMVGVKHFLELFPAPTDYITPSPETRHPSLLYSNLALGHKFRRLDGEDEDDEEDDYDDYDPTKKEIASAHESFNTIFHTWTDSALYKNMLATLRKLPTIKRPVSKIIAFGCNSITNLRLDKFTRERSAYQHAFLLMLRRILQEMAWTPTEIEILLQDSAYTKLDRKILGDCGMTVLESPKAFLLVDDESFIFSYAPDVPVRQAVMDLAMPVGMVWDAVVAEGMSLDTRDPWDITIHRKINQNYNTFHLPKDKHFDMLRVYLRCADGELSDTECERREEKMLDTMDFVQRNKLLVSWGKDNVQDVYSVYRRMRGSQGSDASSRL
ncbi:SRR1 family protein [Aspergillus neoniger CBS 115656]|uniref:SRR1-like domain-containing protein n=1 Tax=Aspergillus neoniger (strain CBS 115656) TaxID=1448310 RepID=A0A318Y4S3_ASPNB|nr:hypothetical protein BO87DRAFT_322217 [Aspergillus neoniger CBS 115656]PYH28447.1 hypothetical protein BO87DRAFT_322217 [Aspergillus neoniger CBS 115656]